MIECTVCNEQVVNRTLLNKNKVFECGCNREIHLKLNREYLDRRERLR